jgi:hypothetical protein
MRIVETDNFGGDYPDEKFVLFPMGEQAAKEIAAVLNKHFSGDYAPRYYIVVQNDYKLAPSFVP